MSTIASGLGNAYQDRRMAPLSPEDIELVYPGLTPGECEYERLLAAADNLRAAIWDTVDASRIDERHVPATYAMALRSVKTAYEDVQAMVKERQP